MRRMNSSSPAHIVFVSVPDSLRGQVQALAGASPDRHEPAFSIDPAIPLPVELPPGKTRIAWDELSGEMILAGMIRVVMEDPQTECAAYYRAFVRAVKPNIMEEFTQAAILNARNGEFSQALEIITALGGLYPQSPAVLLNRALILEDRAAVRAQSLERGGRMEDAEQETAPVRAAYAELTALDPPFPNGLFNAGFFYMKERDFAQAKRCFAAYIPLAEDPEKQERAEELLEEIENSGLDDPAFQDAYGAIRGGAEREGIRKVREFLERRPDVWNGWFLLGWGLRSLGRWEDGAAALQKALELGGDSSDARNELAICLMEMGDCAAARKELETALYAEPENVKIISNLGVLALKEGRQNEAAAFFRTVLELAPGDPVAAAYFSA